MYLAKKTHIRVSFEPPKRLASEVEGKNWLDGVVSVYAQRSGPSGISLARHFDSSWNWVRQDELLMYYHIIFGWLTTVDREITARCIALLNRADPDMLQFMQYNINQCDASKGETYRLAKEFGQKLIDNT